MTSILSLWVEQPVKSFFIYNIIELRCFFFDNFVWIACLLVRVRGVDINFYFELKSTHAFIYSSIYFMKLAFTDLQYTCLVAINSSSLCSSWKVFLSPIVKDGVSGYSNLIWQLMSFRELGVQFSHPLSF